MLRRVSPVRALLPLLLLLPLQAPPSAARGTSRPRYGIPRLEPGQLWVSSVPVGLEVRSGDNPNVKKVLGRTPLILNARDVDRYVTVTIQKKQYLGTLPDQMNFLDFSAKTTHSMTIQHPPAEEDKGRPAEDVARAITYELHLPDRQAVIALFQSRDLSLSDLARLYPPGSNFRFSDQGLQKRLAQKGVPPEFVSAGIQLLHRGGKIALPGAHGWSDWLIAEVTPSGQVDLLEPPSNPPK
jgi:hypothetical protein